jgi:hypothetical protein
MSQALTVEKRQDGTAFSGSGALASAPERLSSKPAGSTTKARTPLSVVPVRPTKRRVPFAVFTLLVLAAALATVLMLNISVSGKQYELVQLRNQQVALTQQNEALVLEVESREAPQNLAVAATELGMVASPTFGTIDLETGTVSGVPEPAQEGPEAEVLIAAPNLGTDRPAPAAAPVPAQTEDSSAGGVDAAHEGDQSSGSADEADATGTIPGPQQLGGER